MTRVVALDTETTGLDPAVEAVFEIAVVELDEDETEHVWTIEPGPIIVAGMHPKAAEVNRYHERTAHPDWKWDVPYQGFGAVSNGKGKLPSDVLGEIEEVLEGAHIVGAVPDFDTRFITQLFKDFHLTPPRWHYHLIDVEVLAVGWLKREKEELISRGGVNDLGAAKVISEALALPYDSDELAELCGIARLSDDERHTALGDARWVAEWYRQIMQE